MKATVLLIATLDTKEEEAFYVEHCIEQRGIAVMVMDVGILSPLSTKPRFLSKKWHVRAACL